MKNYLEHPAEEVLERFLLHGSNEEEEEGIETHIMACDSCVARLESLETEIAATKLALQNVRLEEVARATAPQAARRNSWFSLPKLSLAGACAALALGVLITPTLMQRAKPSAEEVNLVAYRGLETPVLPKGRPLHVNLNASELTPSTVDVDLVDSNGARTWHGTAKLHDNLASIDIPKINQAGQYYFRLLGPSASGERDMLREFSFRVQ